jgi:chromosome segregation ATPase
VEHTASSGIGPAHHAGTESTPSHLFGCGTVGHAARDDDHARGPALGSDERAEERARANALRAQIDELNAEMVVARAEADRALAEERLRADRLSEQVEAGHREVDAAKEHADRAEAALTGERARADALRDRLEQVQPELAAAQHDALAAQQAAAELRQADEARKARGAAYAARPVARGMTLRPEVLPGKVGPAEIALVGALVAVRPSDLDLWVQKAGGLWDPGGRRWLIEQKSL